jgi:4-methylaminobutanoate oxidase (formaldehyde-forming)
MKTNAQVVVIGGGVGGCSILYWLTKLGWRDVVLVDRAELTSGSTFHSAGLVGQLRGSLSLTRMMMSSVELYRTLGAEVDLETGWREVGSLRLGSSPERMEELSRQAGWAQTFGLPLELISAAEAQALFPPMSTEGVLGAAFLPTDGYIDPSQLTYALAEGARRGGAEIYQHTRVTGISLERGRVTGVVTDQGSIEAEIVVNAGGMFAGEIGALAGVRVPLVPMAHEYLVTKPSGLPLDMPTMRDPSLLVYFRPESGGLIMGGYERNPAPWSLDGIPADFNGKLLAEDWPRFEPLMENAIVRVPTLAEMEVVKLINGPEAFTPDGEFILGPTEVRGLWTAAGFCAHGLAGAGGMGQLVAEWIVEGTPSLDTWEMDSRRFGRQYRSREYTLARTIEVYDTYYDVKYPGHERQAGRPLRLSPAYHRLAELGAAFGEKSSWERANWFEPNAERGDESLRPHGWAGRLWSPAIGAEHRACRESAALFDESSFAKIEVSGGDAAGFLEHLCANRVARDVGAITYTQMLNPRGGIECDFTVTRLAADRFRIVTGTAFGQHDLAWIRQHAPDGVAVDDVTSAYACLGLWGPNARAILQPLTTTTLDFPYMRSRELSVGRVPCLALRVTYVGELGWELYCPAEFGLALWDTIWASGREHGLVAGGYKAIDSLRLEKGYRVWGADISPDETPFEAGLGFAVKLDKKDFIGRDALLERRDRPGRRGRGVRRAYRRRGGRRAALRPGGRARPGVIEAIAERIWPGGVDSLEPLGGGITNRNFKVVARGDVCVLRIGGNDTHLLGIDRTVERAAAEAAAALGIGPEVVAFLEPEGYLVTRYVEGETGRIDIAEAAALLRRLHSGPAIPGRFDPFRVVASYEQIATQRGAPVPSGYAHARETADAIERRLGARPRVPCHNDLLAGNFIHDGSRAWIVDWEYAGMGDPAFDLANFAVNNELDDEGDRTLLAAYGDADFAAHVLMRFMSDFREAMWGVVQQAVSEIEFDFAEYTDEHFERLARTAAEPRFRSALTSY